MLDPSRSKSLLPDNLDTFRVATELILLSSRATDVPSSDSPASVSAMWEQMIPREKHALERPMRQELHSQRTRRHATSGGNQNKRKTGVSPGSAQKSSVPDDIQQKVDYVSAALRATYQRMEFVRLLLGEILNSCCDISHSELLNEHRTRFRRVRRRWNMEQRSKKQEHLARFQVQGIPLVQHLEAFTHWR
ncbi:hypothetical protein PsorP6_009445 [Peronosclerospora sorghi]|uniref:Uncharacterized protein n=1 Tax=Peronosclerospora sorghi TaxID=230839 RepID=A0ACC0VY14_9STRA|nr:hypothetical protein PsorP6_009445 [Peronosclerospora sorghi]